MRSIPPPLFSTQEVLTACLSSVRDGEYKDRLTNAAAAIVGAEPLYLQSGAQQTLHSIPGTQQVGTATSQDMEKVYKDTFVKSRKTRHFYDAIKKIPENDICPLCNQRTVFTLDHYLPQSGHPTYTVTPANLVPACAECNFVKRSLVAAQQNQQTLHPYFDNCDDAPWLKAVVYNSSPASVGFSVQAPPQWTQLKADRVREHFRVFALADLYASHSGVELANIRHLLVGLANSGQPPQSISSYLLDRAASYRAAQPNSWQTACYTALGTTPWYYSGGFAA